MAITQIYNKNASLLSFEELYRNAYNLVLRKQGAKLYEAVSDLMSSHLASTREAHSPSLKMEKLCGQWDDHVTSLLMLRDILMYLVGHPNSKSPCAVQDRLYVPTASTGAGMPVPLVYDLGLELYRDIIFYPLKTQIVSQLLSMIQVSVLYFSYQLFCKHNRRKELAQP